MLIGHNIGQTKKIAGSIQFLSIAYRAKSTHIIILGTDHKMLLFFFKIFSLIFT